jgi:hypothetical protein
MINEGQKATEPPRSKVSKWKEDFKDVPSLKYKFVILLVYWINWNTWNITPTWGVEVTQVRPELFPLFYEVK